jgi:cell division protein FtsN
MRERQSGVSFPGLFLMFSLLVLVAAGGFAVGRLIVARAYLNMAPKLGGAQAQASATAGEAPEGRPKGHAYVPSPPREPSREAGPSAGEEGASEGQPVAPDDAAPGSATEDEGPAPGSRDQAAAALPEPQPNQPGDRRYAIQVGLFTSQSGAQQTADDLTRAGFPARVEVERSQGQTLYRVLTGRYRTEYAAQEALNELRQEGFSGFLVER